MFIQRTTPTQAGSLYSPVTYPSIPGYTPSDTPLATASTRTNEAGHKIFSSKDRKAIQEYAQCKNREDKNITIIGPESYKQSTQVKPSRFAQVQNIEMKIVNEIRKGTPSVSPIFDKVRNFFIALGIIFLVASFISLIACTISTFAGLPLAVLSTTLILFYVFFVLILPVDEAEQLSCDNIQIKQRKQIQHKLQELWKEGRIGEELVDLSSSKIKKRYRHL